MIRLRWYWKIKKEICLVLVSLLMANGDFRIRTVFLKNIELQLLNLKTGDSIHILELTLSVWEGQLNKIFAAGKIVSGGSTLSMQVIRMARKGKPRSFFQKFIEIILATRLELKYSKQEILALHASNAPFGGNVVGIDAASWRYFGKSPKLLSWAEAATLAVLPNSPSLIHPGRNRDALLQKRNRLLDRLQKNGTINDLTCELAKEESLPQKTTSITSIGATSFGSILC